MAEAGVPGYEVAAWFGILAPGGTPKPVVELLHRSAAEILKDPAFEKRLLELGAKPSGITPEQFSAMLERELAKWREVAAKNGLKL